MKTLCSILASGAAMMMLLFAGCGRLSDINNSSPRLTVHGVAATGAPISGTVTVKDSSAVSNVVTVATSADGKFTVDVSKLTAPFVLRADWTDADGANQLFTVAEGGGTTNINPFSNATFAAAADVSDSTALADQGSGAIKDASGRHASIIDQLMKKLAPLFALYGATNNPVHDDYEADHVGLDGMFDDVKITVSHGVITVTNKTTGGVIFTAPISNIDAGTFTPANMPANPGATGGAGLYAANCSSCHGPLATSSKLGRTAVQIQAAIGSVSAMSGLSSLTAAQVLAIASALNTTSTTTTPPPTTTPDGAVLYTTNCSGCHGPLATSSKIGRTATQITAAIGSVGAMSGLSSLTSAQIQAIATALAPVSTTPTPTTTTPPPTTLDGAALYAANCQSCHGPLATSSKRGRTAAQIQAAIGSVGAMSGLSGLTTAQIQAIATALK